MVNVGAGTGSYEPTNCRVVAVEPSLVMVAQRPAGAAPDLHARFWLLDEYLPEVAEYTRRCAPGAAEIAAAIGATTSVPLPVPRDMEDGFLGAYWCRPEAYLDPAVRANVSGLALADPAVIARGIGRLEADLRSGAWRTDHADLLGCNEMDLGYRLLVADES